MLQISKKESYGSLDEISLALGLGESSLRTAQSRYPKDFEQMCVGRVGATKVYRLETMQKWHSTHKVRGRPKRIEQASGKKRASKTAKKGSTKS